MISLETSGLAPVLTAAEMRGIEQAAMAAGQATGLDLMERAGRGVVAAMLRDWPDLETGTRRAVVACGPGNNGGDGFVVARLLQGRGWRVEVRLLGDPAALPPDARTNYERWCSLGPVRPFGEAGPGDFAPGAAAGAGDLVLIDALFGTGLTRPVEGVEAFAEATGDETGRGPRVVAIDMPSGLCSDSGRVLSRAGAGDAAPPPRVRADLTVSFHALKRGHLLADGPAACGRVAVADIGLAAEAPAGTLRLVGPPPAPVLEKAQGHKYGYGHALVLSGPLGRSGAARLAARGALRVGAGLVTVAAPGTAMAECAAQLTAIMLRRCDGADALSKLLEDPRLNAVCLGPGLGGGEGTRALVRAALRASERAVVLDADALTAFEEAPGALFEMVHTHTILTPHAGEFARLFPEIGEALSAPPTVGPAYSRADAARDAAARAGCVVLLKGPDTVIAHPDGRLLLHAGVHDRAAPWLATAGTGDVLSGILTGLRARGCDAMSAAAAGAWLHVEAARLFGPGLISEDLPDMLPAVLEAARQAGMASGSAEASSSPSA
jgi:hydroxyethylthiazole kinase-like uncharacterized protein yjeF